MKQVKAFCGDALSPGMTDEDLNILHEMILMLKNTSAYHTAELGELHVSLISRMLSWRQDRIFPCIDLYRMALLLPSSRSKLRDNALVNRLVDIAATGELNASLVLKAFCNATYRWNGDDRAIMLDVISRLSMPTKRSLLPAATLLYNVAAAGLSKSLATSVAEKCVALLSAFFEDSSHGRSAAVPQRVSWALAAAISAGGTIHDAPAVLSMLSELNVGDDETAKTAIRYVSASLS